VARLEKMVFGEARTGSTQSRLSALQTVVAQNDQPDATKSSTTGSTASTGSSGNTDSTQSGNDATSASGTDYPKVNMLEEVILGQTYKQLPLKTRLAQMETKLFGHAGTDSDLSARTDALELHWQQTLSQSEQNQYANTLNWLETQVIGQNYSSRPLIERIQTLDGIVFPNAPPDSHSTIKEQLDTLVNAVHLNSQGARSNTPAVTAIDSTPDTGTAANYPQYNQEQNQAVDESMPDSAPAISQYQTGSSSNYTTGANNYAPQPAIAAGSQNSQTGSLTPFTHDYPGQGTANSYGQGPNNYGQTANTYTQQQDNQSKGHPLLRGLAKALGAAAGLAATAVSSMSLNYGGYGYGMPYGGMGGMGTMGGYGGYGGYGMPYGGMGTMGGYGYGNNVGGYGIHF
jgi:hypothetical protein